MKRAELLKPLLNHSMGGIELVASRPKPLAELTQDELKEFAKRLEADDYTYQRYHGIPQLRVWEALALHHYMDPAVLGLGRKGRLGELKRVAHELLPSSTRLLNFVGAVPPLLLDIDQGKLVCVKVAADLLQSFTTLQRFKSYVSDQRLRAYPQRAPTRERLPFDAASLPPKLRDMWEGMQLWKTVTEGGTVIPGCPSTEPDLMKFFVGKGYSAYQSKAFAAAFRPSFAHIGRRPKAEW
ncbi:hypothetical protein [Polaromonas sp. LjRoot131]|uniref:hypothetical protein n=1 Tax=Polaromonas sp. LjRoot131 TaxID=3342262 RepID=UPI003ECF0C63